jgi:hypothetical protein
VTNTLLFLRICRKFWMMKAISSLSSLVVSTFFSPPLLGVVSTFFSLEILYMNVRCVVSSILGCLWIPGCYKLFTRDLQNQLAVVLYSPPKNVLCKSRQSYSAPVTLRMAFSPSRTLRPNFGDEAITSSLTVKLVLHLGYRVPLDEA